jgi:hypothetical protein
MLAAPPAAVRLAAHLSRARARPHTHAAAAMSSSQPERAPAGAAEQPAAKAPRLADTLRVKRLSEHATLPARGSAGAAGYDLARRAPPARARAPVRTHTRITPCANNSPSKPRFPPNAPRRATHSAHDTVVPARGKALVKTDLSVAIPEGTYARIAPRSGLAWKNFIDTGAGVRWRVARVCVCVRALACLRCALRCSVCVCAWRVAVCVRCALRVRLCGCACCGGADARLCVCASPALLCFLSGC